MVFDSSSPLQLRPSSASFIPGTPTLPRSNALRFLQDPDPDLDELASDDHIPCSPSPYFTQPTQIANRTFVTQPTQIVSRTSLSSQPKATTPSSYIRSSSPADQTVEVPASSPAQPSPAPSRPPSTTAGGRIASRLAPAGTFFRPPQPRRPQPVMKRPAAEPIIISDDEDDLSPNRGDIRPTSFQKAIKGFEYVPSARNDSETERKVALIKEVVGPLATTAECLDALRKNHNDVASAAEYLLDTKVAGLSPPAKTSTLKSFPRPQPPKPSPIMRPKKPQRRLIRGLPPRSSPVSSQDTIELPQPVTEAEEPIKERQTIVLSDDEYEGHSSPSEEDESFQSKTLKFINNSSIDDLAAMTGMKMEDLEVVVGKRPFDSLARVNKVFANKKGKPTKAAKIAIGENVVERIEEFTRAVDAIDEIVAICESKATELKDVMKSWDLDFTGKKRNLISSDDDNGDEPRTPSSLKDKYVDPPVAKQPGLMDGHCVMKPFQVFGLNWMSLLHENRFGCILADEMGLGKTCQVISLICHMVESFENRGHREGEKPWPNLIVVPPSTYANWLAEFRRFAPDLSVIGYQGSQAERREIAADILANPDDCHVVLSTYTQLGTEDDLEAMIDLHPHAAIFDEGHKMKNPKTKVYQELIRIPADWRMLLTGTPIQNNLMEMVALLNFIDPKMFRRHMEHINFLFNQRVTLRDVGSGAFLYSERVTRARTILEPFILQRLKQQVLTDMPAKMRNVVNCDMSETQKPIYESYERLFKMEPKDRGRKVGRANDQNNPWIQLRKAAIHPQLFRRHFNDATVEKMAKTLMDKVPQSELQQPHLRHLIGELKNCSDFELHLWCRDYPCIAGFDVPDASWLDSGKAQKLVELCQQYRDNGDRVLVFSKFAKVIDILSEVLATCGINYCVLSGATDVAERQELINRFDEDKSITAFLLTTGAGGTGINLTAANKVVIFDQSDNPQDDIQAENRAHRLGQTREVEVVRLISSHTIEELIYKACQKKIELAERVTGSATEKESKEAEMTLEKEVRQMMGDQPTPP